MLLFVAFLLQSLTAGFCTGVSIPNHKPHPNWLVAGTDFSNFQPVNKSNDMDVLPYSYIKNYAGARDQEHVIAIDNYFWNSFNGIALEMGAVNGQLHSATSIFEHYFGKHYII
jgi:hypothetical protein